MVFTPVIGKCVGSDYHQIFVTVLLFHLVKGIFPHDLDYVSNLSSYLSLGSLLAEIHPHQDLLSGAVNILDICQSSH